MSHVYPLPASELNSCLSLALAAVDAARTQLSRYANATDQPAWSVVTAADCLDTACTQLGEAIAGGRHG